MATVELISGHLVRMELDTFSRKIKITQKDPDNPDKGPQTVVVIDTYTLLKSISSLIELLIAFEAARGEANQTSPAGGEYLWTADQGRLATCTNCNKLGTTYCQYIDREYLVCCCRCQRILKRGTTSGSVL